MTPDFSKATGESFLAMTCTLLQSCPTSLAPLKQRVQRIRPRRKKRAQAYVVCNLKNSIEVTSRALVLPSRDMRTCSELVTLYMSIRIAGKVHAPS